MGFSRSLPGCADAQEWVVFPAHVHRSLFGVLTGLPGFSILCQLIPLPALSALGVMSASESGKADRLAVNLQQAMATIGRLRPVTSNTLTLEDPLELANP